MKKLLSILMLILPFSVNALELKSQNYVLYNLNEDKIVMEKNKDEKVSIASLTKIMSTIVSLEHIDNVNQEVSVTKEMLADLIKEGVATIDLYVGQKLTYEELIYGSILASGGDAIRALTYGVFGDETTAVKAMNDKVKELNLTSTSFSNVIGLDDEFNYSTANEVASILKYALNNDYFYKVFTTKSYTFRNGYQAINTVFSTGNSINIEIANILGSKTGFTNGAGRALASIAYDKKNKINYLLVTIHADQSLYKAEHIFDAINTYEYVFKNYNNKTILETGRLLTTIPIKYSNEKEINFYLDEDIKYYTSENIDEYINENDISIKCNTPKWLSAFTKKGNIGSCDVLYKDEIVKNVPINLTSNLSFSLLIYVKENIFFLLLILMIFLFFYLKTKKRKKHHKKKVYRKLRLI